jgi:hypothetical protein
MNSKNSITEQLRRNAVALTSLAIAITSLGYNTWRNEASENNRNQRLVSIELLLLLGDLQQLTMDRHYGQQIDEMAVSRAAWAKVLTIRDISQVSAGSVPDATQALYEIWNSDYDELGSNNAAKNRVVAAIENVRSSTHDVLGNLN